VNGVDSSRHSSLRGEPAPASVSQVRGGDWGRGSRWRHVRTQASASAHLLATPLGTNRPKSHTECYTVVRIHVYLIILILFTVIYFLLWLAPLPYLFYDRCGSVMEEKKESGLFTVAWILTQTVRNLCI